MRHALALALVITATWLLWSGHFKDPLLLSLGAASVAVTVLLARRMGVADDEGVPLAILQLGLVTYVPWLVWQIVLSSIDVGKRVWSPSPALAPRMVSVSPSQKTFVGRVLYANSITLTPGTVSVRMYEGEILVHALHAAAADDVVAGEMDRRVSALEGAP